MYDDPTKAVAYFERITNTIKPNLDIMFGLDLAISDLNLFKDFPLEE